MKKLNIRETRQSLSHLSQILDMEGEVTITRRGQEIARIVPFHRNLHIPSHRDLRGKTNLLIQGSEELVREDRDAR
jgi:antitoxin (DNA-binding transcriptional repressor) of toxin-antitoxin stability system